MAQTILITCSTDGTDKLAAIQLTKEGHKVLLHGRTNDKGNARGSFGDAHPNAYNQAKIEQLIAATDRILSKSAEQDPASTIQRYPAFV